MTSKKKTKNKKQKEIDMEILLEKTKKTKKTKNIIEHSDDHEILDINSALELLNESEIIIGRNMEDAAIINFQKTGDLNILEKVYKNRVPTLKSWASKNYFPGLISSVEDLFEDLSIVFIKAAQKYNSERGTFNTCLFTFLINRIRNLRNSKRAKKRISREYNGPLSSMILSLDYSYNDNDGSELTLKDIIPCEVDNDNSLDFRDIISFLSNDNILMGEFLKKISDGGSMVSLLKEYKTRNGTIEIEDSLIKKLNARKSKKIVSDILKSKDILIGDFKLIEYELCGTKIKYKVEMKKTKETDFIIKALREMKKHKDYYIPQIKSS